VEFACARLRNPIVLVHGLRGLYRRPFRQYFPGIRAHLEAPGNRVLIAKLSPTRGVADRANELRAYIRREVGNEPVHIIGHSMGGLDARYMISRLGMEDRVLSLTTVGTPHRGTSFADWGIERWSRMVVPVCRVLGWPYQAFYDLTLDGCRQFNELVRDVPWVKYMSVAGNCDRSWLSLKWLVPYRIVETLEGPNDGVVSVASATWGEYSEVWEGDHLNLVNWPNRKAVKIGAWQDRTTHYGRIVGRLAAAGY
jgi:triacylglycerol lipase